MEIEIGKEAIKRGSEYMNKKMDKLSLRRLHTYFDVDDLFVVRKLSLILFPFNNRVWVKEPDNDNTVSRPELYIPAMGFISYVVAKALRLGLEGRFSPERIGMIFSRSIFVEVVCACAVKVCGYFVDVHLHTLDVVSYNGYKYVPVVFLQLVGMGYVRVVCRLYVYVSFFFFLSRSMRGRVIGGRSVERLKRIYYLFSMVALQMLMMFLLC